jgi:hypothetical protein
VFLLQFLHHLPQINPGGLFAEHQHDGWRSFASFDRFDFCVYESAARQLHFDVLTDF